MNHDNFPELAEAWVISRDYAPASAKQRRVILRRLLAHLPDNPADVQASHLVRWWATVATQAPASRKAHHSCAANFFAWVTATTDYRLPDVAVVIRRPRVPRPRPAVLSLTQVMDLHHAELSDRERFVVSLMLHVGLRAGEVSRLRAQDIDRDAETLVVIGKGGHADLLPLPRSVVELIPADATGRLVPVSPDSVSRVARRALARAGITELRGHALRRTFATAALGRSDLRTVQALLRHSSIATSVHYLAVPDMERMRAAVAA